MKRLLWYAYALLILAIVTGCSSKGPDITSFGLEDGVIARDLAILPQNLTAYAERTGKDIQLLERDDHARENERFDRAFYAAWESGITYLPKDQAFEALANLKRENGFAENLRPWNRERWQALIDNSNGEGYGRYPLKAAITVDTAHLRRLPTNAPYFLNPGKAGEGFPFDYLQNSVLWIGTPVAVIHVSRDKRWVYVQTRLVSGWVEAGKIAAVDRAFIVAWRTYPLAVVTADQVALHIEEPEGDAVSGTAVRTAHIGTLLPSAPYANAFSPASDRYLSVPLRNLDGTAVLARARVRADAVEEKPLPLTPGNLARIGNAMMGQPYGWGGLFEQRDCSSMMRDLFTPFGVWLPRNSRPQGRSGTRLELAGLPADEKELRIGAEGKPFFSLVSIPGHVGLYLGTYPVDGKEVPVMFHNIWGLRTSANRGNYGKTGRAVIGKAVVTTLRPGAEHPVIATPASILDRVGGLAILPPK